jgi:long-chain acyl-CoA synthetase
MAVISLKAGHDVASAEIIEFCKARMAAYKYPRIVEIRDDLPKTASGKILRRELRAEAARTAAVATGSTS